jgi:aspartyl-tRNA(Asn)/glutamyl-tRNA(Gln) amidotransferase subunit B
MVTPKNGEPYAKTMKLTRAHLEEDAGKSLHEDYDGMSGIDLNRAGTPLLEIVTEPDMTSAEEAVAYAKALHALVQWIGICDGNMQEGSFRCDANVSVRRTGEPLGTRCEIKNLNSFNFMDKAIRYEVRRQVELIEDGGKVVQETRLYDPDKDETRSMRSKEDAMDYRYFPDPDLLPLAITPQWIDDVKATMPELPVAKQARYTGEFGLSGYDARLLTQSREWSDYFEASLAAAGIADKAGAAKAVANLMTGELAATLNRSESSIVDAPVSPVALGGRVRRCVDGTLNNKMAKEVFAAMWAGEGDADAIIDKRGLKQISDSGEIEKIVDQILAANAKSVEEFRAGKDKAFNALVGQVMKATKGKANPAQVNDLLKKKLGG